MAPDLRTLLLAQALACAAMAAMSWLAHGPADRGGGLRAWALALAAQAVAGLVLAAAGLVPPGTGATLAAAAQATAGGLAFVAIRQVLGRPLAVRGEATLGGFVVAFAAVAVVDVERAVAWTSLGCGALSLLNARALWVAARSAPADVARVQRIVAGAQLAFAVLPPVDAVVLAGGLACTVVSGLGFLQLCRLRAEDALRRQANATHAAVELARERAEAAGRSRTSFMAAASHDLRQPMHALVQYVEHLRRASQGRATLSTVDKIGDAVTAMEDLLNAVLDYSKISMGAVTPRFARVSVARLCARVDTQVRPLAEAAGLALTVECDGGWAWSDDVLLERVLRNVAQNAVRYTVHGAVAIRATTRGGVVRLLVADSGIGIARADRERIFDEFLQLDDPGRARGRDDDRGLGLGLAIVRDLAALLDVRVRLKSVVGRGSTFALEVRRADAPPHAVAVQACGTDYVRGAFVVLIDDDPLALDGVAATLRDLGCRVLAASSAVDALRGLADVDFVPQIVISDYRLGGGATGLDAIATVTGALASLCGEAFRPPAIVVSGDPSPHERKRVGDAGHVMLHKPVGVVPLHGALNELLGRVEERGRLQ